MSTRASLERRISRTPSPELRLLHARALVCSRYRVAELAEEELDARKREAEEAGNPFGQFDAYDATDDCYLYDRHNPLSPWAY